MLQLHLYKPKHCYWRCAIRHLNVRLFSFFFLLPLRVLELHFIVFHLLMVYIEEFSASYESTNKDEKLH